MKTRGYPRHSLSTRLIACAVIALLFSACQAQNVPASLPTLPPAETAISIQLTQLATAAQPEAEPTQAPTATQPEAQPTQAPTSTQPEAEPTQTEVQPTQPPAAESAGEAGGILFDVSGVAQSVSAEIVPAEAPGADQPWWIPMPETRVLNLQGYPESGSQIKPQIFVYPVTELAQYNETAAQEAASLGALLKSRQPGAGDTIPFLPLGNSIQVMHAQLKFLDLKNGSGVRYLTQYNEGPVKINNDQLVYTFQGLTADGKYYVAVVLPVTHPELTEDTGAFSADAADLSKYPGYVAETVAWLDQQPGSNFQPGLDSLDTLIQSLEVR